MKNYKARKKRKKITAIIVKTICYSFLAAIVLFTVYQLYRAYDANIITEPALEQTVYDSINVDGYIVRDEKVITYSGNGKLSYDTEDAQRAEKNGVLAYVYEDESSVLLQQKIDDINDKIAQLESVELMEGADPSTLDKQIDEKLIDTLSVIDSGRLDGLTESSNQLLLLMNKRQIVTDESDYALISARTDELKQQAAQLTDRLGDKLDTITTDCAGYFSVDIDGCEQLVNYDEVTSMKPEQFELLPEIIDEDIPQNAVGKIIEDYRWYYVFEIPLERISQFRVGMNIDVRFSDTDVNQLTMKLVAINSSDEVSSNSVLGVLECTDISQELISLRRETAQLILTRYTGLRISARAVHYNEYGQMGVYTVVGNIATFKRIYPEYASDNFIICGEPVQDEEEESVQETTPEDTNLIEYSYLEKYDEVIVEGKDLEHGKVVKK